MPQPFRKACLLSAAAMCLGAIPASAQTEGGKVASAASSPCEPVGDLRFLCGLGNAEDLVSLPGTRWIIAGGIGTRRGVEARAGLRLIDGETLEWRHWLPEGPIIAKHDAKAFPGCATPPDPARFMAHGIAVRATGTNHARLYAVNHADRESIEVFDIDSSSAIPVATWVGCLLPEPPVNTNSVAVAPDGTVYATVFIGAGKSIDDVLAGRPTGEVIRWLPGEAKATALPGTSLSGPNGLEISADGELLYVVAFGTKQLHTFDKTGARHAMAQLGNYWPDNVRWDDRGRLLTAGMTNNDAKCAEPTRIEDVDPTSPCYKAYVVEAVDPATMKVTPVATAPTTAAFSHVTVALGHGDRMLLGTVGADRMGYRAFD